MICLENANNSADDRPLCTNAHDLVAWLLMARRRTKARTLRFRADWKLVRMRKALGEGGADVAGEDGPAEGRKGEVAVEGEGVVFLDLLEGLQWWRCWRCGERERSRVAKEAKREGSGIFLRTGLLEG